jgi:hypothetical protein
MTSGVPASERPARRPGDEDGDHGWATSGRGPRPERGGQQASATASSPPTRDALTSTTSPGATAGSRCWSAAAGVGDVVTWSSARPARAGAGGDAAASSPTTTSRRPRGRDPAPTASCSAVVGRADLGHDAEHRPGAAGALDGDQRLEGGADRGRVGVVGVVEDHHPAGLDDLAAPRADGRGRDRGRGASSRSTPRWPATASASRALPTWWRPAMGSRIRTPPPPRGHRGRGRAGVAVEGDVLGVDVRGRILEPDAEHVRRARGHRRDAGVVAVEHGGAVGPERLDELGLGHRDRSMVPKTSRWTPATAVTTATSGATSGARAAMSRRGGRRSRRRAPRCPRVSCSRVSGTPSSLLNEPRGGHRCAPAPTAAAVRSLTVVLPTEPVIATARGRSGAARPPPSAPARPGVVDDELGHAGVRRSRSASTAPAPPGVDRGPRVVVPVGVLARSATNSAPARGGASRSPRATTRAPASPPCRHRRRRRDLGEGELDHARTSPDDPAPARAAARARPRGRRRGRCGRRTPGRSRGPCRRAARRRRGPAPRAPADRLAAVGLDVTSAGAPAVDRRAGARSTRRGSRRVLGAGVVGGEHGVVGGGGGRAHRAALLAVAVAAAAEHDVEAAGPERGRAACRAPG